MKHKSNSTLQLRLSTVEETVNVRMEECVITTSLPVDTVNVLLDGMEISVNVSIRLGEHCECPAGWYGDLCECKYPSLGTL